MAFKPKRMPPPTSGPGWQRRVSVVHTRTPSGIPMRILDHGPDAPLDESSNRLWIGLIAVTVTVGVLVAVFAYVS